MLFVLKIISFFLDKLPDVDFGNIPVIENMSSVFNIFSWINFFIPTGTLFALMAITGTYYVFKTFYVIIRDFIISKIA